MIVSLVDLKEAQFTRIREHTGEEVRFCAPEEESSLLPEADILFGDGLIGIERLRACRQLRWLYSASAGVEGLPLAELAAMGVQVSNSSGIHGTQMAEQCLGLMITFTRALHLHREDQKQKVWRKFLPVYELAGKNLCIVGAGSIGRELARKARAFDMHITGLSRHGRPAENFDEMWDMSRFHDALQKADFVVQLTPLTEETRFLFGEAEFARMKKTAVFVNMSRGDTVDEQALIRALQAGEIGGAALDVFHNEPLEPESPLWGMENVLITPHTAGIIPDYMERAVTQFLKSFDAYRAGEPLPNRIDPALRY